MAEWFAEGLLHRLLGARSLLPLSLRLLPLSVPLLPLSVLCFRYPDPYFQYPYPCFRYPDPCFRYPYFVSVIRTLISSATAVIPSGVGAASARGLASALPGDDAGAAALLAAATVCVVPNMNPDGSYRGHTRTNAAGCARTAACAQTPRI
jgi:hypothetical protein